MKRILIRKDTLKEVTVGDRVHDTHGNSYRLNAMGDGKVFVSGNLLGLSPKVFNLKWSLRAPERPQPDVDNEDNYWGV
jgi:hypothetical protein